MYNTLYIILQFTMYLATFYKNNETKKDNI